MNRLTNVLLFSLFTLAIFFTFGYHNSVFADSVDLKVYIDGADVDFPDVKPYISNDRTLVPVRTVSEQLGAAVSWNGDTGTIDIKKGSDSIRLVVGSTQVIKNGISGQMDVAPAITDGRTMVPLRFVSEELGAAVDWDIQNNSVMITTGKTASVYTVKEGDNLWRISLAYGVSLDEISRENPGMNPDKLIIGQRLNLPAGSGGKSPNSSSGVNTQEPSMDDDNSADQTDLPDHDMPVVSRGGGRTVSLSCTAEELVEYAKEYLGVPYAYGGATPDGFDCSGFTQYVTANFGGCLPHSSSEQYHYGISVEKDELQAGDLVFFGTSGNTNQIGHVGIYIGDGKFIHAPQSGGTVEISNMTNVYFDRYYYGAVRMDLK